MNSNRFERQADLVPQARLSELSITVIGIGAIGRPVALQLAAMGAPRLQLIDPDHVEETNLTTQGYLRGDLGLPKVAALGRLLTLMEPQLQLDLIQDRFRPQQRTGEVVFCCVDSITARAAIWRALQSQTTFWADARMRGEVMRILTATDAVSRRHYGRTLFPQAEAQIGACTAQSTIYTASIAAGLLLHQFVRWLRGQDCDADDSVDLLAGLGSPTPVANLETVAMPARPDPSFSR
jgi:sulfur carrier protein ThiS adenylyltransferase